MSLKLSANKIAF